MISIKSEDVESIYLLSVEEVLKLPKHILAIGESWWLRSPGIVPNFTAFILDNGFIIFNGYNISYNKNAVRPALKIKNLDSTNLELGETVKILGVVAQYIGDDSVLLCESITNHRFDNQSNNYETSEIKRFIEEWLKEKKSEEELKMTREEAKEILKEIWSLTERQTEALQMAIEALGREQQLLDAGYHNATVDFYIGGRLFRAKEIAQ